MYGTWRPVAGHPGYEVSDQGFVRSLDRVIQRRDGNYCRKRGRVLKASPASNGYPTVTLCAGKKNVREVPVHQLVAETFIGPRPFPKAEIRHGNGNKCDPRLSNLSYGTQGQNNQDIKYHGGRITSVLTPDDVRDIKTALLQPYHGLGRELARKFGVGDSLISEIKMGRVHADVVL